MRAKTTTEMVRKFPTQGLILIAGLTLAFAALPLSPSPSAFAFQSPKKSVGSKDKLARKPAEKSTDNKSDAEVSYLDDLQEVKSQVHYGSLGKHGETSFKAPDVRKCRLGGKVLKHSLAMHPPNSGAAYAVYDLERQFDSFRGIAAINTPVANDGLENARKFNYNGTTRTPITFRVVGDGKVLWESKPLQKHGESQECEVSIAGVKELRLEAVSAGESNFGWAFWGEPRVEKARPETETPEEEPDSKKAAPSRPEESVSKKDSPSKPAATSGTPQNKTANGKPVIADGKSASNDQEGWIELGGKNKFPRILQPTALARPEAGGLSIERRNYLVTRKSNYIERDFRFEIVYTLKEGTGDDVVFIGLGEADRNSPYNEPKSSVFLKIHPSNIGGGYVVLSNKPGSGLSTLGKIPRGGTHRARIEKAGSEVTFSIDVSDDGPSEDDLHVKIPDLAEVGPFLNKKNSMLFFGGGGVFHRLRIVSADATDSDSETAEEPAGAQVATSKSTLGASTAKAARGKTRTEDQDDGADYGLLPLGVPGGWAMLPDAVTLVVSVPEEARLVYFDTLANTQIKEIELEFQPGPLAVQGRTLFVGAKGGSIAYALDLDTGKELRQFSLGSDAIARIACHPEKGPVFASTTKYGVYLLNPESGKVSKTSATGYFLAVDPVAGNFLYTGVQPPVEGEIIIRRESTGVLRIEFDDYGKRAVLMKYSIQGQKLKAVSSQSNAAVNGWDMHLTPDGKKIMIVGGGGWRPLRNESGGGYVVAVFGTNNLEGMLGQAPHGLNVAFHPVLNIGITNHYCLELTVFNSKSLVKRSKIPISTGEEHRPALLTFGGKGTKIVLWNGNDPANRRGLHLIPLDLTAEDKVALEKAYGSPPAEKDDNASEKSTSKSKAKTP